MFRSNLYGFSLVVADKFIQILLNNFHIIVLTEQVTPVPIRK